MVYWFCKCSLGKDFFWGRGIIPGLTLYLLKIQKKTRLCPCLPIVCLFFNLHPPSYFNIYEFVAFSFPLQQSCRVDSING